MAGYTTNGLLPPARTGEQLMQAWVADSAITNPAAAATTISARSGRLMLKEVMQRDCMLGDLGGTAEVMVGSDQVAMPGRRPCRQGRQRENAKSALAAGSITMQQPGRR